MPLPEHVPDNHTEIVNNPAWTGHYRADGSLVRTAPGETAKKNTAAGTITGQAAYQKVRNRCKEENRKFFRACTSD
jgi:hypothetical protein